MATSEAGPAHPALAHEGAWTEDAYLALPGDRRVELVDGSLLVAPTTDGGHDRAVAAVRAAVEAALPAGLVVDGPTALRLSPGRILVPDLVISARPGPDTAGDEPAGRVGPVRDSSVALLVIDVVGRGNGVADRWFKPQLYAGSRIPYALLVDHDAPFAAGNMLIGGRYHEYASAEAGEVLTLEEPFALELDLAALDTGAGGPAEAAAHDPAAHDRPGAADGGGPRGPDPEGPDAGEPHADGSDAGNPDFPGPPAATVDAATTDPALPRHDPATDPLIR
ncbi:Uma2 family endonuclease [Pseudonocardia sp.]|uniref:Uma2 family endonuclease n=1 Tax=Pseudonocardia sp. TaxID=60912 RepID=UPI00261456F9|nr:Uma2 family endonuclease [Pseudonocardia sp.]